MTWLTRVRRLGRRPFLDLCDHVASIICSRIWARALERVGPRFYIGRGARIRGGEGIDIGSDFSAGASLWLETIWQDGRGSDPRLSIGSHVRFSDSVHVAAVSNVSIGHAVLIGSNVHITDHSHGTYAGETQDSPSVAPVNRRISAGRPVKIEDNVWIGDGVVVLPGVTIGYGSVVGANSVVSRNLPAGVIAVGSPAVPVKVYDAGEGTWRSLSLPV